VRRDRVIVLRGICIADSEDVSRVLYQSILKTSSRRDHRPQMFACKTDGVEHAVHRTIR
jgi:hypothetical protein